MTSEPIPAGFVLVPLIPTEAMVDAGDDCYGVARGTESWVIGGCKGSEKIWSAMIAAAPTSDSAPAGDTPRSAVAEVTQADIDAMRARLLAKIDTGRRTIGGGYIGTADGKTVGRSWGNEPIMAAANRDGSAAMALIDQLWNTLASSEAVEQSEVSRLREAAGWQPIETAPRDGSHFLGSFVDQYTPTWGYNQSPPVIVHWFPDPEEPGFYLSTGVVQDSSNDRPQALKRWRQIDAGGAS